VLASTTEPAASLTRRPVGERAAIARISLCLTSQAVGCRTPSRRASSIELIPPLAWVSW
jgi:hypothetical protein